MAFNDKQKHEACEYIFKEMCKGYSVRSILNHDRDKEKLPGRRTFDKWIEKDSEIQRQYVRACELRQEKIFEDIAEIADNSSKDTKLVKGIEGMEEKPDLEHIQRSRLRIDARKWQLSKMNPKKYGDRIEVEQKVNGSIDLDVTKWIEGKKDDSEDSED